MKVLVARYSFFKCEIRFNVTEVELIKIDDNTYESIENVRIIYTNYKIEDYIHGYVPGCNKVFETEITDIDLLIEKRKIIRIFIDQSSNPDIVSKLKNQIVLLEKSYLQSIHVF